MDQSIAESAETTELAKDKPRPATRRTTKKPQEESGKPAPQRNAVFIERETDLGFRAYRATLQDDKILNVEPLHPAPDLEAIVLNLATRELEMNRQKPRPSLSEEI